MDINAFMKAYHSHTRYADIDGRDFQMMGTVRLDLEARAHEVYIWSIVNTEQSNGQASKALDWLCAQADKYAVPLELFPERMKGHGKGVPTLVLKKWYGSRGFVKDAQYGFYRREPQMKTQATQRLLATLNLKDVVPMIQNPVKHNRTISGVIQNDLAAKVLHYLQSNGFKHRKDTHSMIGDFDSYESTDFRVTLKTNPTQTHITIEVL